MIKNRSAVTVNLNKRLSGLAQIYTPTLSVIAALSGGNLIRSLPRPGNVTMSGITFFWYAIAAICTYAVVILVYQYDHANAQGSPKVGRIRSALLMTSTMLILIKIFVPPSECVS